MTGAWNTKDSFSEPLTAHVPCGCSMGTGGWLGTNVMWNSAEEICQPEDQSRQYYTPETSDVPVQALG